MWIIVCLVASVIQAGGFFVLDAAAPRRTADLPFAAAHGDDAAPYVQAFTRTLADAIYGAKETAA